MLTTLPKTKKSIASLLIVMTLFGAGVSIPQPARAWDAIPAELLGQALSKIWQQIRAMLLGIAKRVAIQMARDAANRLTAGGSSSKTAFITDYKQYLYTAALDEGLIYLNDLLTTATGGKNSSLNYVVAGGSLQRLGMNYMNYLNAEVNAAFRKDNCKYNLDQYTPNAIMSLGQGDWRVLSATVSYDCNNPLGMSLRMRKDVQQRVNQQQEIAKTKALAGQGFKGVEINGKTVTPGSIISDITSTAQTASFDLITGSNEFAELASAAAGAFVNQALNNLYQRGFEQVAKNVSRELGKVDQQIRGARTELQQQLGPGSQFLRNANQQLGGWSGASTAGKYTGVQESLINFNSQPSCANLASGAC